MLDHIQHFTQTAGSVKLTLQTIEPIHLASIGGSHGEGGCKIPLPITMWTHCPSCQRSSRATPMSLLTWHFSFMKFIDLLINSPACLSHQRSTDETWTCCSAKGWNHCFSMGTVQATFRLSKNTQLNAYLTFLSSLTASTVGFQFFLI